MLKRLILILFFAATPAYASKNCSVMTIFFTNFEQDAREFPDNFRVNALTKKVTDAECKAVLKHGRGLTQSGKVRLFNGKHIIDTICGKCRDLDRFQTGYMNAMERHRSMLFNLYKNALAKHKPKTYRRLPN